MIVSELKPVDEIAASLDKEKKVFIVGCGGCADACETGGHEDIEKVAAALKEKGKEVTGAQVIDFLCNKTLVGSRLMRKEAEILAAEAVLVCSCGIGVQAVANMVSKRVLTCTNTIAMGGTQGLWPSSERCNECGDCLLSQTGGICPLTACAKGLLNGQCGGAKDGKCEVTPERDCGWQLIYSRLKEIGREDLAVSTEPALRDYRNFEISDEHRKTTYWALEVE
jgi:ferredoxin